MDLCFTFKGRKVIYAVDYLHIYVTVCTWGCHFSLPKGVIRASTSASLFSATIPAQLTSCIHRLSLQNKSWHDQSNMWWHLDDVRDFRWWHSCQHWKGIKGRCMRGWGFQFTIPGFQVLSFECIEPSSPPQEYFGVSWHWVSQEFLHSSEIMCLVFCFITVMYFACTGHWFLLTFLAWLAT